MEVMQNVWWIDTELLLTVPVLCRSGKNGEAKKQKCTTQITIFQNSYKVIMLYSELAQLINMLNLINIGWSVMLCVQVKRKPGKRGNPGKSYYEMTSIELYISDSKSRWRIFLVVKKIFAETLHREWQQFKKKNCIGHMMAGKNVSFLSCAQSILR
jgi:hypothetical protein